MSNLYDQRGSTQPTTPTIISPVDAYVVQSLQSLIGRDVVVQTTKGSLRGCLRDVKPDHVVVQVSENYFFTRIAEIVWVMPY